MAFFTVRFYLNQAVVKSGMHGCLKWGVGQCSPELVEPTRADLPCAAFTTDYMYY